VGMSIEEVAAYEGIELRYEVAKRVGGVSMIDYLPIEPYFESLVEDGLEILAREPSFIRSVERYVLIVQDYKEQGVLVSKEQTFWHEFYHLGWSEDMPPYDPRIDEYITYGVRYRKDERHADLFAASVLIDRIAPFDSARSISLRSGITPRLAQLAIDVELHKRLFSRDWTPVYENVQSNSQP
jgi:hypothetical protein